MCVSIKKWGGGGWGRTVAWSTGGRYNRILDPVMSYPQGVRQGGVEKKNQPDKRPIKKFFLSHDDHSLLQHGGTQCKENSIKGQSTYKDRVQSSVWRLPNYGPPPPSPPSKCALPLHQGCHYPRKKLFRGTQNRRKFWFIPSVPVTELSATWALLNLLKRRSRP